MRSVEQQIRSLPEKPLRIGLNSKRELDISLKRNVFQAIRCGLSNIFKEMTQTQEA